MKKCAIILNGKDVVKVTNFPRKYNKLTSNPKVSILEECELDEVDDRYNYWKSAYVPKINIEEDLFEYVHKDPRAIIYWNKDGTRHMVYGYGEMDFIIKYNKITPDTIILDTIDIEYAKKAFDAMINKNTLR